MTWTKFQGFVGPSYPLKSKAIDSQRLINMFPEMVESGSGKEGQVAYLKSLPGYEQLMTVGTGPIRMVHIDSPPENEFNPTNRVFIASGAEMYKAVWDSVNSEWDVTWVGDLNTSSGPMYAASAKIDLGVTVFVDGSADCYIYWLYLDLGVPSENFNTFSAYGYIGVENAIKVIWIDGYFVFIQADSGNFYVSDWNSLNVDPLSFAVAEGDPDNILSVISNHRDLIMLNERSTEIYVNTGNADFPFERIQGGFIEKGLLASDSVAKIDGKVYWLARNEFGQGEIVRLQGMVPQRISTHAVEEKIASYASPEDATAYTYQHEGHLFYVINFAEATWCFDAKTEQWFEMASLLSGALQRHRLNYLKFFPLLGIHIAADYETNKIYKLNDEVYLFGTEPIVRERVFPHISASGKFMRCNALRIDMEVGVGLNGTVQGSDPKVMLKWSDDDGRTWSNERTASIGKIGETSKRVIFWRLGSYKKRIYKLRVTDPIKLNISSVEVDIEVGVS